MIDIKKKYAEPIDGNWNVKKQFGLVVKHWRTNLGISQDELASRADLHRTYVSDIERGARNPSLQSIEKLAKALKVSLSGLFLPLEDTPDTEDKSAVGK